MKSIFTLLFSVLAIGLYASADEPSNSNEYFICTFNNAITPSEISDLTEQGYKVIEKDSTTSVIVKTKAMTETFTPELKTKMQRIIKVDEFGNRTNLSTRCTQSSNPDFFKLLFNFI